MWQANKCATIIVKRDMRVKIVCRNLYCWCIRYPFPSLTLSGFLSAIGKKLVKKKGQRKAVLFCFFS